jgi:hypothetical protein
VGNDLSNDRLTIMPGYWFLYNMYALARNSWKYIDRDKRTEKVQYIEYDYLAPDTINEILTSIELFEEWTGQSYLQKQQADKICSKTECIKTGRRLLKENDPVLKTLEITATGLENAKRKTVLLKIPQAYSLFNELIEYHAAIELFEFIRKNGFKKWEEVIAAIPSKLQVSEWLNIGGQLMPKAEVASLKEKIKGNKIKSWDEVHKFYQQQGNKYPQQKLLHALAALQQLSGVNLKKANPTFFATLFDNCVATKEWMVKGIYDSRAKDYQSDFRKMVYDNKNEMDQVIGKLDDNSFIQQ